MPFEFGIFFSATRFNNKNQKSKNALIFEKTKFTYQNYLSDLSRIDTKAHENNTFAIIQNILDWLYASSRRASILGHLTITEDFINGQTNLPDTIKTKFKIELEIIKRNELHTFKILPKR